MKIAIIGAGMMGSALAFPARENGNDVRIVGTPLDREIIDTCKRTNRHPKFDLYFPAGITYYQIEDVLTAIKDVDFVICGVSSFGVDWFGDEIFPLLPEGLPILSVTKGLLDTEDGRLLTYPQVWQSKLDRQGKQLCLNAIGGACTSYELASHDHSHVTFCGPDATVLHMLKQAMATDYYHISLSHDVTGVESAVALKNGYGLGLCLTVGLNILECGPKAPQRYNSQAAIFAEATREMRDLLAMQGAPDFHNLMVGIGDMYVTVYGGRTRIIGTLLGKGLDIDEARAQLQGVTLESLVVAERVARALRVRAARGEVNLADFPLLMHIDDIITKKAPVSIPWDRFTFEAL